LGKTGLGFDMYGIECDVCKSMAEMARIQIWSLKFGDKPDPES